MQKYIKKVKMANEEIERFYDLFSEKKSSENILLDKWMNMSGDNKVKAFVLLQEKRLLNDWIQILYKYEKYGESQYLCEVNFASGEIYSGKNISFYMTRIHNGGREKVVQLLANEFARNNWNVTIITIEAININDYELDKRINRVVLPADNSQLLPFLIKKLREFSIDIFASHHWLDERELLMFAYLRESGIRVCLSDHNGLREQTLVHKKLGAVKNVINCGNIINGLTCLSRLETLVWRKFGQKVAYMPNPIEIYKGDKDYEKIDNSIVWIGRLERYPKQPDQAIRAFSLVLAENPNARLTIVGAEEGMKLGSYHDELKKLCRELKCEKQVYFVGFSSNVQKYLYQSSVHWLTSDYEGFPLVWVEAKSCGVPTVLYDIPWVELNGKGSIVVNQGDYASMAGETIKLLDDKDFLKSLSKEAGDDLFERFNPELIFSRWEEFYTEILNSGQSTFFNEEYAELREKDAMYFKKYLNLLVNYENRNVHENVRANSTQFKKFGNKLKFVIFSPKKFLVKYANKARFVFFSPMKFLRKYKLL